MSHRIASSTSANWGPRSSISSFASVSTANRYGPSAALSSTLSTFPLNAYPRRQTAPPTNYDDDLDDSLHTFTPEEYREHYISSTFNLKSWRGWTNALALVILAGRAVMLLAGCPIIFFYYGDRNSSGGNTSGFNLGGINAVGSIQKYLDFRLWSTPIRRLGPIPERGQMMRIGVRIFRRVWERE